MSNSLFVSFKKLILLIIIIVTLISCFFIPALYSNNFQDNSYDQGFSFIISSSKYIWPTPGYTSINSYFGKRYSPTAGASSFHKGIDIGAPQGSNIIAITSGKITFTGFLGGGGYTITLSKDSMKVTYCHVSPNYIVEEGDIVRKGDIIGYVGPKNVYGVKGNPYTDSNGNPTNGATTGPHLHLGVRINEEYIDPLSLFRTI